MTIPSDSLARFKLHEPGSNMHALYPEQAKGKQCNKDMSTSDLSYSCRIWNRSVQSCTTLRVNKSESDKSTHTCLSVWQYPWMCL